MSSSYKTLYHVTTVENYQRIMAVGGIDPEMARGRFKRCYYIEKQGVHWAIAHVAARDNVDFAQLVVLKIKARAADFMRVSRFQFYCTQIIYKPYAVESAREFIARTERNIMLEDWIENGEFWPNGDGKES